MQSAATAFQIDPATVSFSSRTLKHISPRLSAFHEMYLDRCVKLNESEISRLYTTLDHGTAVLHTADQLDLYMALYAEWHWLKLGQAFDGLNVSASSSAPLTVYDWGCGQGIGTIGLLDSFERRKINAPIERIVLIEPSSAASCRAVASLTKMFMPFVKNTGFQIVNKSFENIMPSDILRSENSLHIFSNVIDVAGYRLDIFAGLLKSLHRRKSGYVCVSPLNFTSIARMTTFCRCLMPEGGVVPLQQCDTPIEAEVHSFFDRRRAKRNITRCQRIFARYSV